MTRTATTVIIAGIAVTLALGIAIMAAKPGTAPRAPASAASPASAAPSAGPLTAHATRFDFGAVSMAGGKVSHRHWLRNESAAPVRLQKIYTSCMCTTATLVKAARIVNSYGMPGHGPVPSVNETLAPGEAAYLDVVFDPAAHGPAGLGRNERVVTVETDAGPPLELLLTAHVRP